MSGENESRTHEGSWKFEEKAQGPKMVERRSGTAVVQTCAGLTPNRAPEIAGLAKSVLLQWPVCESHDAQSVTKCELGGFAKFAEAA